MVPALVEWLGLQNTLWVTFTVGLLAPVSAILAGWIYRKFAAISVDVALEYHHLNAGEFNFSSIKEFEKEFWIVCGIIFFYFSVFYTFLADGPKFLKVRLGVQSLLKEISVVV